MSDSERPREGAGERNPGAGGRRGESELPRSAQRVQQALAAAGIPATVVELPDSTRTAEEAAAAVGCRVEQIVKSLVFRRADDGKPVLVLASGGHRVDEGKLAAALGSAVERADPAYVREATGFAIGGVPPLGHPAPIETLVDAALLDHDTVWAAAGTPRTVFSVGPTALWGATRGRVVTLGE